jgi:RNA polymerase sigma-70 factor (ECF subfamily)
VLQETFILIFKHMHQYKGDGAFGGWLRTIAVTTSLKALRKRGVHTEELEPEVETRMTSDNEIEMQIDAEEILDVINMLPDTYRHVFNLYLIEGYSHTEIAEMLEIQEATSRARLTRARAKVKELMIKKNMTYEVAEARKVYTQ